VREGGGITRKDITENWELGGASYSLVLKSIVDGEEESCKHETGGHRQPSLTLDNQIAAQKGRARTTTTNGEGKE